MAAARRGLILSFEVGKSEAMVLPFGPGSRSTRIALHMCESDYTDLPSVQKKIHITAVYKHLGGIMVSNGSLP